MLTCFSGQFEQVYVLNMASRTDKLDAMRLAASLSGFSFVVNPGVNGKDVNPKSLSGVSLATGEMPL